MTMMTMTLAPLILATPRSGTISGVGLHLLLLQHRFCITVNKAPFLLRAPTVNQQQVGAAILLNSMPSGARVGHVPSCIS